MFCCFVLINHGWTWFSDLRPKILPSKCHRFHQSALMISIHVGSTSYFLFHIRKTKPSCVLFSFKTIVSECHFTHELKLPSAVEISLRAPLCLPGNGIPIRSNFPVNSHLALTAELTSSPSSGNVENTHLETVKQFFWHRFSRDNSLTVYLAANSP